MLNVLTCHTTWNKYNIVPKRKIIEEKSLSYSCIAAVWYFISTLPVKNYNL